MRTVREAAAVVVLLAAVAVTPGAARAAPAPQQTGYLGVRVVDVDSASAARLQLPAVRGARVESVADSSPAASAGLKADDVITEFAGQPVESVAALTRIVGETPPGREVSMTYYRGGSSHTVRVRVGRAPGMEWYGGPGRELRIRGLRRVISDSTREHLRRTMDSVRAQMDSARGQIEREFRVERFRAPGRSGSFMFLFSGPGRLGVELQPLSEQLGAYFGVTDGKGALVSEVRKDSPAEKAGLKAGDVIVSVGGKDVEDPGDVVEAIQDADQGPLKITVMRKGARRTVTVDLPARPDYGGRWTSPVRGPIVLPAPGFPAVPGAMPAPVRRIRELVAPMAPGHTVWLRGAWPPLVDRYI